MFAAEIRRKRVQQLRAFSKWKWYVDEAFVKLNGKRHNFWRAVDHEGEVLEAVATKRRNKQAALKFLRKSMKRHGKAKTVVTDRFASYRAPLRALGTTEKQRTGRWLINRVENSHLPFRRREHVVQRFRRMRILQKLAAVRSSVYNHFNQERSLASRDTFKLTRAAALREWPLFRIGSRFPQQTETSSNSSDSTLQCTMPSRTDSPKLTRVFYHNMQRCLRGSQRAQID